MTTNVEKNLHVEEFKIRLKPGQAELIRSMALQLDIPPAVLLRHLVVHGLEGRDLTDSLRDARAKGRAH
ncbi:hypothetical protein [Endozoicomonas sp. 4G]|uniref:hypothetical protein n=1 Tax=Endozoicomonas sp. 4G TaxID=2872754 RepID=UPI00207874C1|nr:hypothetical protein [Endozoicomonas sp. 4G]